MDTLLLKTFLEVTRTRHFAKAAENLHVAPSTISTRIRQLEQNLGLKLLIRNHQQVAVTPAGERLMKHARLILSAWDRAFEDVALSEQLKKRLVIAGPSSLWDIFLQDWLNILYRERTNIGLRAEESSPLRVVEKLDRGLIDLGFLYEQPKIQDMSVVEIQDITLILVADNPDLTAQKAMSEGYIRVEWGTTFNVIHEAYFIDRPLAAVRVNSARIALELILKAGGCAYLPKKMVEKYLATEQLYTVKDAPEIPMQAYAAYSLHGENKDLIRQLLKLI
ncbi:MAG: LysR family transcriptional regulator [Pseudomonadales bacterium]|nr:LysR family transcriptional regulator [Pseudomonadales bacterium]NRA14287.1 LysR family transcriptional regulator [Oceanospirillaceae bacterium]